MKTQETPLKLTVLLAFAAVYIIWGTTYLAIVIGLKSFPPFILASIRYVTAAVILLAICAIKGEQIFIRSAVKSMLTGAVVLTGGQAILFWAEKYIASGLTAVLVSTLPIWFVILDKSQWRNYFSNKYIIAGLITGFCGILLLFQKFLFGNSQDNNSKYQLLAVIVVLLSCIFWVSGSLYSKYRPVPGSLFLKVGWQLTGGLASCLIISFLFGEYKIFSFAQVTASSWAAVLYLAIAGSIVAFGAYTWLIKVKPAAVVGTFAYVNPVIAVLAGCLIANEKVSVYQLSGMVIILVAAFLINKKDLSDAKVNPPANKKLQPTPCKTDNISA